MAVGFPEGPFRIARRFVAYRLVAAVLMGLAAIGCAVGYGYMAWGRASGILHDERIWNAGGAEVPALVEGRVTTRQLILKSYDLKVTYGLPNGGQEEHQLEFDTLFGEMEEGSTPTVRLDPISPHEFALAAAVNASSSRWAGTAFIGAAGMLIAACCAWIAYASTKQLRRVARAARHGSLRVARLIRRTPILHNGRPTGTETFEFAVPSAATSGPETLAKHDVRTKGSDVITSPDAERLPPWSPRRLRLTPSCCCATSIRSL